MSVTGLVTDGWISKLVVDETFVIEGIGGALQVVDELNGIITEPENITGTIVESDNVIGEVVQPEAVTGVIAEQVDIDSTIKCVLTPSVEFDIETFATAVGLQEIGATVVQPAFTASYNRIPTTALLDDSDANPQKDVSSTPTTFSSNETFQKTANNGSVTFTLTADDGDTPDTAQTSIAWQPRTYWGLGGASLLSEAEIEALPGNQLDSNFATVFIIGPMGAAEYGWYCFPQSYDPTDAAQFQVGPFVGGWQKIGVVSVTNVNGVTQNYACWRTDFPGLDEITVTVF